MAPVRINTGPAYHEDKLRDFPKDRWPEILSVKRYYVQTRLDYDCRCLVLFVQEADEFYKELGYETADDMLREELAIRPEWARMAVAWLEMNQPDGPVGATTLDEQIAAARAEPLKAQGRPVKVVDLDEAIAQAKAEPMGVRGGMEKVDNVHFSKPTSQLNSNSKERILRRIARDQPDLLDDIGPDKPYRSVRQAAIAAGIVKDIPTVRLTDPDRAAVAVVTKAGREWAAALAARLTELLTEEAP